MPMGGVQRYYKDLYPKGHSRRRVFLATENKYSFRFKRLHEGSKTRIH